MRSPRSRPGSRRLTVAVLLATTLLAAACGGGEPNTSTADPSPVDAADATSSGRDHVVHQGGCGARGAGGEIENLLPEASAFNVTVVFRHDNGGIYGTGTAKTGTIQPGAKGNYTVAAPIGVPGVPATCVVSAQRVEKVEAASPQELGTVNFVALAATSRNEPRVFVSNNGERWALLETTGADHGVLRDVAHHDGLWVAVSEDKQILTSRDGTAWESVFTDTVRFAASRVFYEDGRWVAMPTSNFSESRPVYSNDGATWEPGDWGSYKGDASNSTVVHGQGATHPSGRQFAVSERKSLLSREGSGPYGLVGEPKDTTKPRFVTSVGSAEGTVLVTSHENDKELAISTDGSTWTFPSAKARTSGANINYPEDQAYANGTWIVVTSVGHGMYISTDRAATWDFVEYKKGNDPAAIGNAEVKRVAGTG